MHYFLHPAGAGWSKIKSVNFLVCIICGMPCCPIMGCQIKKNFHKNSCSSSQDTHPPDRPNKGSFESWMYFFQRSRSASSRRSFCRFPSWAARILIRLVNSESRVVLYIFLLPTSVILDQKIRWCWIQKDDQYNTSIILVFRHTVSTPDKI